MSKYNESDIHYHGETNGVHSWSLSMGQPYYWHPDWLHIAEDMTGHVPVEEAKLHVDHGEQPTKEHAVQAILRHINEWAHKSNH
ncbi:hypothetical protein ATN88_03690 [Enterovibrio coralii]|uniref:Uncharacterized protein n=1 Tax=Enterovibrio coralii TaxID=294935 RepID=A0A135I8H3_9GAMM|nr:hypothetical protein ATN88_03690 [Enterovibrio coralii]